MIQDQFRLVILTLMHRRLRSWLTIIGVIIGVAAIVSLITLGEGLKQGIEEQFEQLGISNIRVIPGNLNGPPSEGRTLPNDIIDKIENVRGVDYVDSIIIKSLVVEYNNVEIYRPINGFDTESGTKGLADLDINLLDGRFLSSSDSNTVLLGYDIAKDERFFDKEINVKNSVTIGGEKFSVIGILEETGAEFDSQIFIPMRKARDLFNQKDTINGAVVHLEPGIDLDDAADNIKTALLRDLDEEEFDLFTPEQILDEINAVLGVVQLVVSGIAAISLLVGAVGIMNSMFTSVLERTNEIGLMKAIGAKNSDVLAIFLIESGLIGLVGGLIGVIIGSLLAILMGTILEQTGFLSVSIQINPVVILIALSFAFLVGVISGAVPAIRASNLNPVEALRYE